MSTLFPLFPRRTGSRWAPRRRQARRLAAETLERRELLAGDLLAGSHNYQRPYDVNDDGKDSSRDALAIINYLNQQSLAEAEQLADVATPGMFYDVNADDRISSVDALEVMNALAGEQEADEIVELLLSARNTDDVAIEPDENGVIQLEVGQEFDLEISYQDLRQFGDGIGLFQLYTDILFNEANVLEPVLRETQFLHIDDDIRRERLGATLTFSIEDSTTTYVAEVGDFAANPAQEVTNALNAFGYRSNQFRLGQNFSIDGDPLRFSIFYTDPVFNDVDLPNVSVVVNSTLPGGVSTQQYAAGPRNPDGSIDGRAIGYNVDFLSRTFNENKHFFSTAAPLGISGIDPDGGITGLGGIGRVPTSGGGVPDLTDDGEFINPFDAFSIRVKFNQPVVNFAAVVVPAEHEESVLAYGLDAPVPHDLVWIDEDARIRFNVIDPVNNAPPLIATGDPLTAAGNSNTIGGQVFVDELQNSGEPARNGMRDAEEAGVRGVMVKLTSAASENASGTAINVEVRTDSSGTFVFPNVVAGTYRVQAFASDDQAGESGDMIYLGAGQRQITIGASDELSEINFALLDATNDPASILASSYLDVE